MEEAPAALRGRVDAKRGKRGGGAAEALFALGAEGDAEAEQMAGSMVDVLGAALGSAANLLDVTLVVLGGGLAPGIVARLPRLRAAMASTLFARRIEDVPVVPAAAGPLAGAIGAARAGMRPR